MTTMQGERRKDVGRTGAWDYAGALTTVEEVISIMLDDGLEETDTLGEAYENAAVYNIAMGCRKMLSSGPKRPGD